MCLQVARIYIHPSTLVADELLPSHVHVALVGVQVGELVKSLPAQVTTVRPLPSVDACVYPEVALRGERLVALGAAEGPLTRVHASVYDQTGLLCEKLATLLTPKALPSHHVHRPCSPPAPVGFLPCVDEQMALKTMGLCEFLLADVTAEGLHAFVDGEAMTSQIIHVVKLLSTLLAGVRLLPSVERHVSLQGPFISKGLATGLTCERFLASVDVHVSVELPEHHEGFAANLTYEALLFGRLALEGL